MGVIAVEVSTAIELIVPVHDTAVVALDVREAVSSTADPSLGSTENLSV